MEKQYSPSLIFLTLATVFLIALPGCYDSSLKSIPDELKKELIDGTYQMEGTQIKMEICYISQFCEPGEVITRDTTQISFEIRVEKIENRQDTLRFHGLENAPNDPFCSSVRRQPIDCGYALLSGNKLKFDLLSPGGSYVGSGILRDGVLKLETQFRYRGKGVDYIIEGTKVQNK